MLTEAQARAAKPQERPYKLSDARQLYLYVSPKGGRSFRLDYALRGRRTYVIGRYPEFGLRAAREAADDARKLIAKGVDPNEERERRRAAESSNGATVEQVGTALFRAPPGQQEVPEGTSRIMIGGKLRRPKWVEVRQRLRRYIYPKLGQKPIAAVTAEQLNDVLQRVLEEGKRETARRLKMACNKLWARAVKDKHCAHNIVKDVDNIARTPKKERRHLPSIKEPRRYGDLLRAIGGYGYIPRSEPSTQCAWEVLPTIILRSSELRYMRWSWINFDLAELRVPPEIMKRTDPHIVPLPHQVVASLRRQYERFGHEEYVFPSGRDGRPLSENTLNLALVTMGLQQGEMCAHGVRSFFSTQLREHQWPRGAVEVQLAHMEKEGGETEEAYNYAEFLPIRRIMMQWWADYLDSLKLQQRKPKIPYAAVRKALAEQSFLHDPDAEAA